jgi:hypothetical protein
MLVICFDTAWDVEEGKVCLWGTDTDLTSLLSDETVEAIEESYWEQKGENR